MRRLSAVAAFLLVTASGAAAQVPQGFTPIFNGRDLSGWHVSRTTHQGTTPDIRVEDGAIVLRQAPYGQGGILLTDRKYRDFELYLELKPDWGTNGGVFFRSSESGSAYQVEVIGGGASGTGNLLGEMLRVNGGATAQGVQDVWRDDAWNSMRLRVVGTVPRVTLWINGTRIYDHALERNDLIADATDGFIALQTHWTNTYTSIPGVNCCPTSWRPGAAHRYRNIAIREIQP